MEFLKYLLSYPKVFVSMLTVSTSILNRFSTLWKNTLETKVSFHEISSKTDNFFIKGFSPSEFMIFALESILIFPLSFSLRIGNKALGFPYFWFIMSSLFLLDEVLIGEKKLRFFFPLGSQEIYLFAYIYFMISIFINLELKV